MVAFFVITQSPTSLPHPAHGQAAPLARYRTGFGKPRKMGRSAADPDPPAKRRSHAIARRRLQGAAAEKHGVVERRHGQALTPPARRGQDSTCKRHIHGRKVRGDLRMATNHWKMLETTSPNTSSTQAQTKAEV